MQSTVSSQTALFPCYDLKLVVAWKADIYRSHNSLNRCFDVNIQQIASTWYSVQCHEMSVLYMLVLHRIYGIQYSEAFPGCWIIQNPTQEILVISHNNTRQATSLFVAGLVDDSLHRLPQEHNGQNDDKAANTLSWWSTLWHPVVAVTTGCEGAWRSSNVDYSTPWLSHPACSSTTTGWRNFFW